ncbi:MAG TPA: DUF192 domain-containing protein [Solirubrobacterales bacterium]|jgi:hypothetical protein
MANRFRLLPRTRVLGREVAVAVGLRSRVLGLALLDRERAGAGLLIPRCRSVHTFGMRFPLDVHFLDEHGRAIAVHRCVPPNRVRSERRAVAVLEIPTPSVASGGELERPPT